MVVAVLPLEVVAFLLVVAAFLLVEVGTLLVAVVFRQLVVALLHLPVAAEMNHRQTSDAPAAKGLDLEHPSWEAAQLKLRQTSWRLEDSDPEACPRSDSELPLVSVAP